MAEELRKRGVPAGFYHAQMSPNHRFISLVFFGFMSICLFVSFVEEEIWFYLLRFKIDVSLYRSRDQGAMNIYSLTHFVLWLRWKFYAIVAIKVLIEIVCIKEEGSPGLAGWQNPGCCGHPGIWHGHRQVKRQIRYSQCHSKVRYLF